MPVKPPNTYPEFYSELLRAFGTVSDSNQECGISIEQYTKDVPAAITGAEGSTASNTGAFYVGIDLESYSNVSNDTIYSGTNTSTDDIFAVFRFAAQGAGTTNNIRIDSYALYDQLVLIQNGVCTVNY
jgi:competence transcription factor ComK